MFLYIFNEMFKSSSFPESWREVLVKFIPKGGFRPISLVPCLTKLFERIVNRRMEVLSESEGWLPDFQFGFRRGRSAIDAVSFLVTGIYRAFGEGKSLIVLALDIKGAINGIVPDTIIEELINVKTPSRITNFISFLIFQRYLHFSPEENEIRVSGVAVPQGGVLSPFLFSLALRAIKECLSAGISIIMYADDILIYTSSENVADGLDLISLAFNCVSRWLLQFGLEVSIAETQFTVFTRSNKVISSCQSITLDDQVLPCCRSIKYLGIQLD